MGSVPSSKTRISSPIWRSFEAGPICSGASGSIARRPLAISARITSWVRIIGGECSRSPAVVYTTAGDAMRYEHILVSADAGLATITMNRPERRNALSEAHMRELIAALRAAGDQPDVRAVILAANGSVFCSGHDFADMIDRDLAGMRRLLATCTDLMLTIRHTPQP